MNEKSDDLTLGLMDESEVLARIFPLLPESDYTLVGPGDDSAVISAPDSRFVITTDMMVHGPDFRLEWSSARQLGFKAAATNMADVAAMGAQPTSLVVSLAAPKETQISWLEEFARGMNDACSELSPGCGVVGGDLSVSNTLTISVTACGDLQGQKPLLRNAAEVGDVIAYAGQLGLASLGLAALFDGKAETTHSVLLSSQREPRPPIALGVVANTSGAHAAMDVSDSLVMDAGRIAKASKVSILFYENALDDLAGHIAVEYGVDAFVARKSILFGGEDHGLLVTFPRSAVIPEGFMILGEVIAGNADVFLGEVKLQQQGWNPYTGWDGNIS